MSAAPERDPSLRDLLRIFDRRRRTVLTTALVIFSLSVLACIFTTRRYQATSVIQLQKSPSDSLDLDDLMGASAGGGSDSLSLNVDLQTQADILQSDTLALTVIKELNLEQNADFKVHFSLIGWATGLISPAGPPDPASASIDDSPGRRKHALLVFQDHLKVKALAGTRLIEVDFTNRSPKVAADVVNHLVQALTDYTFQTKFSATNEVSQWLEEQLGDLRKQSEDLQTKVVALQQVSGIFGAGATDLQGKPVVYSPVLDRLAESTAQLSQAKMSRILKASVYEVVKTGNAELISQLSGNAMGGVSSQGVTDSLSLIRSLRTQEASLKAQVDQDASQFGPAYPRLVQERASLKGIEQAEQEEISRIGERARNDFEVAAQAERGAQATYDEDHHEAERLNDKSIEYAILSKEANESQDLYQDLLKRLKEAGILEGLHSSNVTVVDRGSPPSKPSQPQVPLYLTLGIILGPFFGGCAALLVDALDNKVQGSEEIDAMNLPILGLVPQIQAEEMGLGPILLGERYSAFGEAVRSLRSALILSRSGKPPQVILLTSSSPKEGKSTLGLNLAVSLSQLGKKVLLVEADIRRPVLAKRVRMDQKFGLSVLLSNQETSTAFQTLPDYPNLSILPGGPPPPYPSELIGSQRMESLLQEWRKEFDFIVMDSPPVLLVTDAQLLTGMADATVLLVRAGLTSRLALLRSYRLLTQHARDASAPTVGVVANFIPPRSAAYYGYYGYYGGKKYDYEKEGGDESDS